MVWRLVRYASRNAIRSITSLMAHLVFDTKSQEVTDVCLDMFNCQQQVIALCKSKFLRKFGTTDNVLCCACVDNAVKEMSSLSSISS